MTQRKQIETTLFYAAPLGTDFADLSDWVTRGFKRIQITAQTKYASDFDLAFAIGGLTLTVALSPVPLDLRDFSTATCAVPAQGPTLRRQVSGHRAAVAVRVSGPTAAASEATRLAVCYIATMQVLDLSAPTCLHWGASDTLYALETFFERAGETPRPTRSPATRDPLPHPPAPPRPWMPRAEHAELNLALETLRSGAQRRVAFPTGASEPSTDRAGPPPRSNVKPTLMSIGLPLAISLAAGLGPVLPLFGAS